MMPPDIKRVPKPIAPMPYPEASGVLIALALFLTATLIAVEFDVLSPKIALGAATLAALAASIISVASTLLAVAAVNSTWVRAKIQQKFLPTTGY